MPSNPDAASGQWLIRSEEPLYTDPWLDIRVADVELPDGRHLDHRIIRTHPGAGAAVTDQHRRVLLLWRHRFITGTWGWEIPIGRVEDGEDLAAAAAREVEEETGWRPGPLTPLLRVEPTPGISTSVHHLYRARSATQIGPPEDDFESSRIDWVPLDTIPALIQAGEINSGTTLAALLYILTQDKSGTR